jgi:hypothetical protein
MNEGTNEEFRGKLADLPGNRCEMLDVATASHQCVKER